MIALAFLVEGLLYLGHTFLCCLHQSLIRPPFRGSEGHVNRRHTYQDVSLNVAHTLSDFLDPSQRDGILELICGLELLPISCLYHAGDEPRVISPNRVIPDDFIYMPTRGQLDCRVSGQQRVISPGEFMMVPAGKQHGVTMAEGTESYEVYALHMHLYDEARYRFLEKLEHAFGSVSDKDVWFRRLGACVCMMGKKPQVGGQLMNHLVVSLLLEQFLRGSKLRHLPARIDERMSPLLAAIRSQPQDDWSVSRMAQQSHLSVSRFREIFIKTTGTSPKKYVQNVRLSLARSLLMTSPLLTVEQVADRVGISDAHYFHAVYKKQFGETPKKRS
jgi:AraC-like DNA-binding protein